MKNILIIILAIVSLFLLAYSFIKADEATKARMEAEELKDQAVQLQQNALDMAATARMQEAEAMRFKAELEACKSK